MDIVTYAILKKKIDSIGPSPYKYKGSVSTYDDLPLDSDVGDMYSVDDTGESYVWSGSDWHKVSNSDDADAGEVEYDSEEDYDEGTVGYALNNINENVNKIKNVVRNKAGFDIDTYNNDYEFFDFYENNHRSAYIDSGIKVLNNAHEFETEFYWNPNDSETYNADAYLFNTASTTNSGEALALKPSSFTLMLNKTYGNISPTLYLPLRRKWEKIKLNVTSEKSIITYKNMNIPFAGISLYANHNIWLFRSAANTTNTSLTFIGRIKYVKIKTASKTILFLPVKKRATGKYGLLDVYNNYFAPVLPSTNTTCYCGNFKDEELSNKYSEELFDTIKKCKNLNNSPSLIFPWVTDLHVYNKDIATFNDTIENISNFCKLIPVDFIANTGDITQGLAGQGNFVGSNYNIQEILNSIKNVCFALGNHDLNIYNGGTILDEKNIYTAYYTNLIKSGYNELSNGTDYYVDFTKSNIRVICLNANYGDKYRFSESTAEWLQNILDSNKLNLILTHLSPISTQNHSAINPLRGANIKSTINSFIDDGGKVIMIMGHTHADYFFTQPWLNVAHATCSFDNFTPSGSGYGPIEGEIGDIVAPHHENDDYTKDCWSICIVKPLIDEFDLIRFGAGSDKIIHYNWMPLTTTETLTTTLSDVTWHTSDSTVATVSSGVVTKVANGKCSIYAKDDSGNIECWNIKAE